jgi:hypothetical protein
MSTSFEDGDKVRVVRDIVGYYGKSFNEGTEGTVEAPKFNHNVPSTFVYVIEKAAPPEPVFKQGDVLLAPNGQVWIYSPLGYGDDIEKVFVYAGFKTERVIYGRWTEEFVRKHCDGLRNLKVVGNFGDFTKGL